MDAGNIQAITMPGDPFHFEFPSQTPLKRAAVNAARPFIERALGLETFRSLYRGTTDASGEPFAARALRALHLESRFHNSDLDSIPRTGAVIVAANHPHGLADGLLLMNAVMRVRSDVRVLTNHLLSRIPELRESCFFVDPFDGPEAAARSRAGLRAAHLWLRAGGLLIVFPAGEVAHSPSGNGTRTDSPWKPTMGRLAIATAARIVPALIEGQNSPAFYAAGRVHPALRTLLLPRELLRLRGSRVTLRFGQALSPSVNAEMTTTAVRSALQALSQRSDDAIATEVAALPHEALLLSSGAFDVYCVSAERIPRALREIGRLRAVTYAAVGEGSGQPCDLDRFDETYLHLFSWDRERRCIVGAYRLGQTDRLVESHGVDALYSRTLFRYDERFIERLGAPALEMGRSFVRTEYQRNYSALLLLWKGIGRFITRHPQYRLLFGPVSISQRYSAASRQILRTFLQHNHAAPELSSLVAALLPPLTGASRAPSPGHLDEVNALIERTESDGKGVPVLLRQYLKLGAKLLGFSVDPAFGNTLDALMVVDLAAVDRSALNRYLGRDVDAFLARHRAAQSRAA